MADIYFGCTKSSKSFNFVYLYLILLVQVSQLRQRFFNSIAPGGLAGDRRGVIPASGFSFSAQQIWKVIRENKDLDLPAHKVCAGCLNYIFFPYKPNVFEL